MSDNENASVMPDATADDYAEAFERTREVVKPPTVRHHPAIVLRWRIEDLQNDGQAFDCLGIDGRRRR